MKKLKIKLMRNYFKLEEVLPEYKTVGSAGMDLKAALTDPITINPGERKLIPTGIAIALNHEEKVALIYPRSGLSTKFGIALANGVGVIDSDYRGEIFCPLINLSDQMYVLNPLERIAQLVIMPVKKVELEVVDDLEATRRGKGGFGSTGK